jgi:hypothetical protein
MKYKYTTRFDAPISSCIISEHSFISKASLENLKPLLPQNIDFNENIDLIGVAYNAAVVNRFNKNDDGMDSATAARIIKNFLHKPTNIEHDKSKIVGHIVSAGFSEYGTNKPLNKEEIVGMDSAFNIALGSVVYKYANKDFASLIERSLNPEDSLYQHISTSWEVGFSDYVIAIGSTNLKDAEIIENPKMLGEMRGKLKAYGGSGKLDDGTKIYRLLRGDIYPLGIGFTTTPAADVKGLYSNKNEESNVKINDKRDKKQYFDIKKPVLQEKKDSAISQILANNVKIKKENIMDVEKLLSELKDLLVEKKFSEEAVANMTNTFAEAIKQKDVEYRESLTKAQDEREAIAKQHAELKASMENIEKQLSDATQKIVEFEALKKEEEALARFNSRMEAIDQEYDLDDEDRKVLVEDLKSLDASEEAFASYQNKLSIMWRHKNKEAKASLEKSIQEKIDAEVAKKLASISKASVSNDPEEKTEEVAEVAEEALENAEVSEAGLPNSNEEASRQPKSLREKFAGAFSRENIVIS